MNIAHGNNVQLTEKRLQRIKRQRESGVDWDRIALNMGMSRRTLRDQLKAMGWGDLV